MKATGDKDARTVVLKVDRHKDADSTGEWGFQLVATDIPCGSGTLVPTLSDAVDTKPKRRLSAKSEIAMQALDDALANHGERKSGDMFPSALCISVGRWREFCDRHCLASSDSAARRSKVFRRAKEDLHTKSVVRIFDEFVWRAER